MPPGLLSATSDADTATLIEGAAAQARCALCAQAAAFGDALVLARRLQPDVCVMDARLHHDIGRAVRQLAVVAPSTAIVVVAGADDSDVLVASLTAGAHGCALLDTNVAGLGRAVTAVLAGEVSVPRTIVAELVAGLDNHELR